MSGQQAEIKIDNKETDIQQIASEQTSTQQPQGTPVKNTKFCSDCGAEINAKAEICPKCGVRIAPAPVVQPTRPPKDKTTAIVLAFFLGGLGAHKFYFGGGSTKWGVIYLVFCWTFIPAILSLIEAVMLAMMDQETFHATYG